MFESVDARMHGRTPARVPSYKLTLWAFDSGELKNQQNDSAPSEDSDQPGHPHSLIRVFAVCSMGS